MTVALSAAGLAGQERSPFNNRRELGGHTFLPSAIVGDPFIASYIRSATGAGMTVGLEVPVRDPDGTVLGTLDGKLAFLLLEFEYQQAIGSRVALRAGGTAAARVGVNEESILSQGLNALYGLNVGATVKLWRFERFMLSAIGDYTRNKVYAFNLFDFLQKVVEEGYDPEGDNSLLVSGPTDQFTGGIQAAYSPWRWLGLTGLAEGGGGSPFRSEIQNRGVGRFGISAGVDFGQITPVPIGILGSFRWSNFEDTASDVLDYTWASGLSVGYTGRDDFYVGLRASLDYVDLKEAIAGTDSDAVNISNIELLMRYFF